MTTKKTVKKQVTKKKKAVKTLDNLVRGDMLIDNCEDEVMVHASLPGVVLLSEAISINDSFKDFDEIDTWYLVSEMKRNGYTLKGPAPKVKEMTVEEVSLLVGRKVKIVAKRK